MRIQWLSNAPWVCTGYGMQTATACAFLPKLGHELAIQCLYGLQGSSLEWNGVKMYPNNVGDFGTSEAYDWYQHFEANVLITLIDAWVLDTLDPRMNWVPWVPVDHDPVPARVVAALKNSAGLIKPIAMSRFGQRQLADNGIESYYIPHGVNTLNYRPNPDVRKQCREQVKWEDKFVIGSVATNHAERKNWTEMMKAVAQFSKMHPGEVKFYAHTEPVHARGINLLTLRDHLGLNLPEEDPVMVFPVQVNMKVGIEQEAISRIYNSMDVFLLPSKGEGFGIPIIEAQACGVPVIITKCTGHEELMGGGWFIENLTLTWESKQDSQQFLCTTDEIVERLEQAYQAKKDGSIKKEQKKAREHALEYDEHKIWTEMWPEVLADIEERIKAPRNLEGVQPWRKVMIPAACLPRKVLDLGCGVTKPYQKILEPLGEYVAVDVKGGDGIMEADASALPFTDKEFGFVWCSEMLEHCDEPEKVVAEAKRVGAHGVIMFSTPVNPCFKMDPEHRAVPEEVGYTLTAGGDGMITW